jgi:hypothetical protein
LIWPQSVIKLHKRARLQAIAKSGANVKISKTILLSITAIFAIATAARAGTRDDVKSGMERCDVIQDDRTWLDCLYGAEQPMRARLGLPPAPEFQQRLVPPAGAAGPPPVKAASAARPVAQPRRKAGFFGNLFGDASPVAVSRMVSYHYEKSGAFVVTLENGQDWRQTDVEGGAVPWSKPASAYQVTITQGAFGSFNLHTDDNPHQYKVELIH